MPHVSKQPDASYQPGDRAPLPEARLAPRERRARLRQAGSELQGWAWIQAHILGRAAARCIPALCVLLFIGSVGIGLGMILGSRNDSSHRGHWRVPTFQLQDIQLQLDEHRRMMEIQQQLRLQIEAMSKGYEGLYYAPSGASPGAPVFAFGDDDGSPGSDTSIGEASGTAGDPLAEPDPPGADGHVETAEHPAAE